MWTLCAGCFVFLLVLPHVFSVDFHFLRSTCAHDTFCRSLDMKFVEPKAELTEFNLSWMWWWPSGASRSLSSIIYRWTAVRCDGEECEIDFPCASLSIIFPSTVEHNKSRRDFIAVVMSRNGFRLPSLIESDVGPWTHVSLISTSARRCFWENDFSFNKWRCLFRRFLWFSIEQISRVWRETAAIKRQV